MARMIFVNLPVSDLPRSIAFYEAIGAQRNALFSDDTAACMVVSDMIFVMLLTNAKFAGFTGKTIADAHTTSEMLLCLSEDSRAAVDAITLRALSAGGRETRPAQDHGFMYGRSFEDPDGHIWEAMWMAPAAIAEGPPA